MPVGVAGEARLAREKITAERKISVEDSVLRTGTVPLDHEDKTSFDEKVDINKIERKQGFANWAAVLNHDSAHTGATFSHQRVPSEVADVARKIFYNASKNKRRVPVYHTTSNDANAAWV